MTTRVAVIGAAGRLGSVACRAVDEAADLELVAAVSPSHAGTRIAELTGVRVDGAVLADPSELDPAGVDVAVEATVPSAAETNVAALAARGVDVIVGTSGITDPALDRFRSLTAGSGSRVLVVPNFSIGAVLMMRAAAQVARYLPDAEIVELHHDTKLDAPSGTALRTAELIAGARGDAPERGEGPQGRDPGPGARGSAHHGVNVHSVRLPGLVAHQAVVFGAEGQTLTIRHDTLDRSAFAPGIALACRRITRIEGVVVGLEHVLDGP